MMIATASEGSLRGSRPERDRTGSLEIEQIDPLAEGDRWDRFIAAYPKSTAFHSSGWARVLASTYRHRPFYLRIYDRAGRSAYAPMMEVSSRLTGTRGVSLPFSDECQLLIDRSLGKAGVRLHLEELARDRSWDYLELRGKGVEPIANEDAATYLQHELILDSDLELVEKRFQSAVRRGIRKAQASGLDVSISNSFESVQEYYDLHIGTRKRHGLPPQPFTFFDNIYQHLIAAGLGFVIIVHSRGVPVAGALFILFQGKAAFKFGASKREHWPLRPNNLVMWEAIRHLVQIGASSLHFGRTASHHLGLLRFKRSWGTEETPIPYSRFYPRRGGGEWRASPPCDVGRICHIFSRIPSSLNRLVGSVLYSHLD